MTGIVKKLQTAIKNRTTYRVGLLQARAFRALKTHTRSHLSQKGISTVDWALLGTLNDYSEGMKSGTLAQELGVKMPFVTELFKNLNKIGLVDSRTDALDSRVKVIFLTPKGFSFVSETEASLREHTKLIIEGISKKDIISYVTVLEQITENFGKITR